MTDTPAAAGVSTTALSLRNALLLLAVCAWVVICLLVFVVLAPPTDMLETIVRLGIVIAPLGAWAMVLSGIGGRRPGLLTLLVLMLLLTDISLRRRAFSDTSLDPQNLVKIAVWGMGLVVALFHLARVRSLLVGTPWMWMLILALWCTATAVYSPIPAYSLGAGISFISMVLFGVVVREAVDDRALLKAALAALGALVWISLLMYVAVPDRAMALMEGGGILRLAGPFGSPNNLGRVAAIALLICTWAIAAGVYTLRSPLLLATALAAVACLVLSQSRTATLALVASVALVFVLRRLPWLLIAMVVVVMALLGMSLLELRLTDIAALVSRTGHASEITTMTGRTDIWSFILGEIRKEPLFGTGFASTKYTMPLGYRTFWGWTTTSAHNVWLQTWVTTGLIGVVLMACVLTSQLRHALRVKDYACSSILAFILILGMAEPGPFGPAPNLLTLVWAVWVASPRARGEPARAGQSS